MNMAQGRPNLYTEEIADEICNRLADGESLRNICKDDHLPSRETVRKWLSNEQYKSFLGQYARAREEQADSYFEEAIDIADNSTNDYMEKEGFPILNSENIQRSRLRVDTRKWAAGKLNPKKYGDKLTSEITGKDGGAVQVETRSPEEIVRNFAFTVSQIAQDKG